MLCYKSSPCVSEREEGPLRGSDRGDTRKAGGRHAIGRLHGRIPQAGPLLNVPPAPATVEDSRLAWRRFRGFF